MKTAATSQSLNYLGALKVCAERIIREANTADDRTVRIEQNAQRQLELIADLSEAITVEQLQASRLLVAAEYVIQQLSATGFADSKAGKALVAAIAAVKLP